VRPLLSALTKLDPIVAVAPEHPNLSTRFRSGGLLNNRRYPHPRLPYRQFLRLSPQTKTFVVTKTFGAKSPASKKAVYNCELVATFSKSVPLRLRKGSSHV